VIGFAGDAKASISRFRGAIERARKIGALSVESSDWITFGLTCLVIAEWQTAIEAAHEARRIAEHMRSRYHLDTSDAIEGYALFQLGEQRRGRTLLEQAVDELEKSGMHLSLSLTLASYADVLAAFGETDKARLRAEAALTCAQHGDRLGGDLARRILYRLDAAAGDRQAADASLNAMREQAEKNNSRRDAALADLEIARATLDRAERKVLALGVIERLETLGLRGFVQGAKSLI
jgi:tetratricopeptide (TPR) repeat protein